MRVEVETTEGTKYFESFEEALEVFPDLSPMRPTPKFGVPQTTKEDGEVVLMRFESWEVSQAYDSD